MIEAERKISELEARIDRLEGLILSEIRLPRLSASSTIDEMKRAINHLINIATNKRKEKR